MTLNYTQMKISNGTKGNISRKRNSRHKVKKMASFERYPAGFGTLISKNTGVKEAPPHRKSWIRQKKRLLKPKNIVQR